VSSGRPACGWGPARSSGRPAWSRPTDGFAAEYTQPAGRPRRCRLASPSWTRAAGVSAGSRWMVCEPWGRWPDASSAYLRAGRTLPRGVYVFADVERLSVRSPRMRAGSRRSA